MKKFFALFFAFFIFSSSVLPAYATELDETERDPEGSYVESEPVTEPTEPPIIWTDISDVVFTTTSVNMRSGPGTEYDVIATLDSGIQLQRIAIADNGWCKLLYQNEIVYINNSYLTLDVPEGYVEEYPVVELSENSVSAIADAVVAISDVPTVTNKLGNEISLYDEVSEYWDQYEYHLISKGKNGYFYYFLSNTPIYLNPSNGNWYFTGKRAEYVPAYKSLSWKDVTNYLTGHGGLTNYLYSDHNILDNSGNILYESDIPVFYTVNFVTNIDGYYIDSQSSDNFSLPSAEWPNMVFLGWYTDQDLTQPFGGGEITSDMTLYAKWTELPPMTFFSGALFEGLTVLFSAEPIFYMLSIMALAIIVYIIRMIIDART